MNIRYSIWSIDEYKNLNKKFKEHNLVNDLQLYYPILSLFFNYKNNKNSKKIIDIKKRFKIIDIINCNDISHTCSNKLIDALVLDNNNNFIKSKNLFLKTIPIIDIVHYCTNKYDTKLNSLPSNYKYNYLTKINDMNNTAYIDAFFSYIASELYLSHKTPSLAIFYGSYVGIGDYKHNISSDYSYLKESVYFNENIGKLYDIAIEESESSDDMDLSKSTINSFKTDNTDNTYDSMSITDTDDSNLNCDIYLFLKNIPLKQIIIEKLENTLEYYLSERYFDINIIISCFFQITFCLAYLQKHFNFTHNDLHIDNIMFTSTKHKFLYYKLNNIYFKVPTYGKIFKIIDYGRSIFDFKGKTYFSDCFSKYGEADGQYTYPIDSVPLFNKQDHNNIPINYSFDLCRLSTTILDSFEMFEPPKSELFNEFLNLLKKILLDKNNNIIYDPREYASFSLYINIAKNACNGIPKDILFNPIFNIYKISKKETINKHIYTLN
uniref:Protein kinase domain-containing protein n=1 Tax=viral metagenome TaxID=1070528 RepID=A0A6C0CZT4_9ZZZZ